MKQVLLIIVLFVLAACGTEPTVSILPEPVPDQEMTSVKNGVSLSLKKDSFTESQPTFDVLIRNNSLREYNYGAFYHIEANKEGLWYMITYSDAIFFSNTNFKDLGNLLPVESEVHETFSVKMLDVELSPGEYRLVKTFASRNEPYYELSVATPFTIR